MNGCYLQAADAICAVFVHEFIAWVVQYRISGLPIPDIFLCFKALLNASAYPGF